MPRPSSQIVDELRQERILVTGAGGSIGSALALRLAEIAPRQLILLESSESALFALESALAGTAIQKPPNRALGNVQDASLLDELFAQYRPSLVFHAAAFKHVPLLEGHPLAAIENNVFGTKTLASAAAENGARIVLLSTDKAVEPASIMGATKWVAEQIVLGAGGTVLRLGNVLASSNSVAESFARQIVAGGPLTVTDPAARRYFLTIDEAVDLLIAASGEPERPVLLAPDLRSPQYITDLARFMAYTLAPDQETSIDFTEPRSGDKELEKLWSSDETAVAAATQGLVSIRSSWVAGAAFDRELGALLSATCGRDLPTALAVLRSLLPDFTPSAVLLALAQRSASRVTP
ncbi:MAG: polysaccharide biosynthesis protein [Terracidiphilus sp.]